MSAIGRIRYYDSVLEKVIEFDSFSSWFRYYEHHEKKEIKEEEPVCDIATLTLVLPEKN